MTIEEFKATFKEIATEYLKNERLSYLQEMAAQLENLAMKIPGVEINTTEEAVFYNFNDCVTFSIYNSENLLSLEFQDLNSIGFVIEAFIN